MCNFMMKKNKIEEQRKINYLHHEPEFKCIHFSSTLDGFVPSIIVHIIELVLELYFTVYNLL
jgi:hypothetical protein